VGRVVSPVNRYQYARFLGVALTALGAGVLALSYPPPFALAAQAVLLVVSGVLQVLSGTPSSLRERVGPHRLLGLGNVALGASLAVSALGDAGTGTELVYTAAVVVGGAGLAFVGLAYVFRPGDFGLGPDGYPE